jgi:hypothetical protein
MRFTVAGYKLATKAAFSDPSCLRDAIRNGRDRGKGNGRKSHLPRHSLPNIFIISS